jgi:hypothetical protein
MTAYNPNEVTSDDRLMAALAYVFSPLVPIIFLLMEDKKTDHLSKLIMHKPLQLVLL